MNGNRRISLPRLRGTQLLLLILGLVTIAGLVFRPALEGAAHSYQISLRRRQLMAAAEAIPFRSSRFRLSGENQYRPALVIRRGQSIAENWQAELRLQIAAVKLREAVGMERSAGAARDRAAGALLTGHVDDAIRELESYVPLSPQTLEPQLFLSREAGLLNDLAAAYERRAEMSHSAVDRIYAIVAAKRARDLAPTMVEAAWNYASAIEMLGLVREGRTEWTKYLELDAGSPWSDEARQRLNALNASTDEEAWSAKRTLLERGADEGNGTVINAIAEKFPLRVETIVEQDWIPRWAAQVIRHDRDADRMLGSIEDAADGISKTTTDSLLSDFVVAARDARDAGVFAAPHAHLRAVRETLRTRGTAEAVQELERTISDLKHVGSPFASVSQCELGGLLYHGGWYGRALEALAAGDADLDSKRHPILAARASWNRGVSLASLGRVSQAAAAYATSLNYYRRTSDETRTGMLQLLLGDNAELTSNVEETWRSYLEAVRQVERHGELDRDLVVLDRIAGVALRQDHVPLASLLADGVAERAREDKYKPYFCHAMIVQCGASVEERKRSDAVRDCSAARGIFFSIADRAVRNRLEADLELAEAGAQDRGGRMAALTRAVDLSEERRDVFRLSRVLLTRARAHLEDGASRLARIDLEHALQSIEDERRNLDSTSDRLMYYETARSIADELIRVLVREGQPEAALRVADRVRARVLLETITGSPVLPSTSIEEWRRRLASDHALIEYWSVPNELYAWVVREDSVRFFRRQTTRRALFKASDNFVAQLETEGPFSADPAQLSNEIVSPAIPFLRQITSLTIVADAPLEKVPFAALRLPTGKYLIEEFVLTQSPSAATYVLGSSMSQRQSILLLANPVAAGSLPRLAVHDEVAHAVHAIKHADVYEGAAATPTIYRSAAGNYDVIHIAAHGLDDSATGEPAIALTPARATTDGLMTASEIAATRLRTGALVVLAACRGASGRTSLEGTLSLSRAFATAGARTVVASLWDASDADSGQMFSRFYSALATGASPAAALRAAQLSFIRNPPLANPRHWAAYQIYGGA